jgi:signal transduction histidine kinase
MARVFNSDLVMMEDRISWLEERIRTMAVYNEHPLRSGIGARGHRAFPEAPDPFVMIDLGATHLIDRMFLVPSQRESLSDSGIFPRLFTIEVSEADDFSDSTVIFTTGKKDFLNSEGRPIPFAAFGTPARYLRMTVHRGHNNKGWLDKFGLSEIIVMAGNDVVSFGAEVRITSSLDSGSNWYPQALTDGRMPHGIWHSGLPSEERGDGVIIEKDSGRIRWEIDLGEAKAIDRMVLFPYKFTTSMESSVIANRLTIESRQSTDSKWKKMMVWNNRPLSSSCVTPLVFSFNGQEMRMVRITADQPWQLGDLRICGLSEIELWSGGQNIAKEIPVYRTHGNQREVLSSLTNGFSSEHMVANIGVWLDQLHERLRFENELAELRPKVRAIENESELNITLASAILLSLTFLIPVFVYEKRRSEAKQRVETLRKRIAADLHDDVGGNLGSISLIARSARIGLEKISAPEVLTHDLEEVELIARESSLAMRDIVWLVEQRDDSMGDLVQRMRETAERMLREIEYSLTCDSKRTDSRLSVDFKRHFFLFFKETLHNILKHSKAQRVTILLDDDRGNLVLEIQDDGIGMPQEIADDPNTSRKLRQRAEVLGGNISITSSVGNGTCIRLAIRSKKFNTISPPQ